jgi:hypothetical protein
MGANQAGVLVADRTAPPHAHLDMASFREAPTLTEREEGGKDESSIHFNHFPERTSPNGSCTLSLRRRHSLIR